MTKRAESRSEAAIADSVALPDKQPALRVVPMPRDRGHLVTASGESRTHAAQLDALAAERRIVVVADQRDPRHRWHDGHQTVVRPATVACFRVVPQRKHGLPARP